jgi:hypothetical protein
LAKLSADSGRVTGIFPLEHSRLRSGPGLRRQRVGEHSVSNESLEQPAPPGDRVSVGPQDLLLTGRRPIATVRRRCFGHGRGQRVRSRHKILAGLGPWRNQNEESGPGVWL